MAKTAFLFPGQGAQYVGMGADLAARYPAYRRRFEEASDLLGFDLLDLTLQGPEEQLMATANTQPAILSMSVACLDLLAEQGLAPDAVAGLSLGEYSALVAAGSLAFKDALPLVRQRGQFMQEAVPLGVGGMAAVLGLTAEEVEALCQVASSPEARVWPANYNCPGQIVVAGHLPAVEAVVEGAQAAGAKAVLLPVSAPFHTPLLEPASSRLDRVLSGITIRDASVPVYANVTGLPTWEAGEIRQLLVRQVSSPVRFEESIRAMIQAGVEVFVEIGPGRSLSGFVRKVDRKVRTMSFGDAEGLVKLLDSVGRVC